MQNKFKVGDKVKEKTQPISEGGEVVKIKFDSDSGFSYVFATKEVNIATKEVVIGTKVCTEDELEVINEK